MKTLDEVIKNFEICRKARLNIRSCDGCTYADDNDIACISHNECDVLHYLKEYREEIDNIRTFHDDHITMKNELAEIKNADNDYLTWNELLQMEGKPVWIEMDGYKPNWGIVMNQDKRNGRLMLCGYDKVTIRIEINKEGEGTVWKAYRKEK